MSIRIEHHDGPVETLDVATYTIRTASGRPVCRCPACGGFIEIEHPVAADGEVEQAVACPYACSFFDHVRLDDWAGP